MVEQMVEFLFRFLRQNPVSQYERNLDFIKPL